ncbi:TraC family protein [Patescibacteria group bacterium]|nr:TraC family protein [Patescibacteria group bacterium]MBU4511642.1 TraC family protein [Patescibacteria group bacterium]MCG2692712.1 TraC family protein [Candidatus Parcubacteria bacterium]
MPKLAKSKPKHSTQQFLDIAEIRDDVVIMKDGSLRAVILVSSINFALKSEEEQNAIVGAYVGFLNSIDSPLQIVIQSRKLDIDAYLEDLQRVGKEQSNELLKMQTQEYVQYVKELVEMSEIMTKHFYAVVSYNPLADKHQGFFTRLFGVFAQARKIKLSQKKFAKDREELSKRTGFIINSLTNMGLGAAPLDSQSLIELYYKTYNPEISEDQKMVDVDKLRLGE